MAALDRISAGLAQRGIGKATDGNLPNWHPEAHKAAANVRRAFQGVYADEKVNQLALEAAQNIQNKIDAGTYEGPETTSRPVSEQQRRGHGQEGSAQAAGPGPNEQEPQSARDKIKAGLAARRR